MRWSFRPLLALLVALFIVACARAVDRLVGPPDSEARSGGVGGALTGAEMHTAFGPQRFVRGLGTPVTERITLSGYGPSATLRILNGNGQGAARVSSGTVLIDDVEVVPSSAFAPTVGAIVVPVTLRNTSVISVRLASAPGDEMTLFIDAPRATSAKLDASGGSVHLLGSTVTLVAPPGAVGGQIQLTADSVVAPRPEALPGTSIEMGPSGTQFSAPVTLSIQYDPAMLPTGVRASSLRMKWWNAGHWEGLAGNVVDEVHHVVSAQTTHFTTFALLPNEVVFCPGDAGAEQDLRTAITNVPEDGTVYVCDGTHQVPTTLIDKPLTLRSLSHGGATLQNQDGQLTSLVLRIDSVASGTVRVADLGIAVSGQGINANGTFDRVKIDSVRFVGLPGFVPSAVVVNASTVPGARVDVTNSDFSQLQLGVWPVSAVETNVSHSRFDRFTAGAVVYSHGNTATTQSFGRTEDNVFTNCGASGCIRVLTAGGVTIARNQLEALDQSVTLGAITIQAGAAYPNASPTVIEDNVIISRRTGAAENTAAGWMFQSGIYVSDPNVRTTIIRRNHVTDAYSAVTSTGSLNATDNWFSGGFYAIRQTALRDVIFQRNDAVGLLASFTLPTAGTSVQCNWWGSTAGPTAPPTGTQWAYTPWANEPIAGTSVACTPVPVPPVPPLATITLNASQIGLTPAGTWQFTATGRDANGNVVPFIPTWSVVNGGGSLSAGGLFTAGSVPGTYSATVRATSGAITASATVIVGVVTTLTLTPNPANMLTGATQTFVATARDAAGNVIQPPSAPTWSVVNGGGSISASGQFTAGSTTGTFVNTVSATLGGLTATASVSVFNLASLTISPASTTLSPGAARQFTATGRDSSGASFPVSPVWSVANGGGTIASNGFFTAGSTTGTFANTVTATLRGISATATVIVGGALASIAVTPNTTNQLPGGTVQFSATGRDAIGNVVSFTPVWSVVNGGGSINASTGLFTAGSTPGTYTNTIRAASGAISGTASVTVKTIESIVISPTPWNLAVGTTVQFTAMARTAGNVYFSISPVWSVANGGGTINPSTGLFTAGAVTGSYANTITATYGAFTATTTVTVTPTVASFTVSPNPGTVRTGGTLHFTATGRDAGGNVIPVSPTWSVVNGGGTVAWWGDFFAGSVTGTFANTVVATVGSLSTSITVNVVNSVESVRVCSTPGTGVTVSTLAQAYDLVVSGGTIQFCDGTHSVESITITKPLTITAEGPGQPVLEAATANAMLYVSGRAAGTVSVSSLKLRGLQVQSDTGATSSIVIENNAFEDCGTYACVGVSIPARIQNNTFTAHIEHPFSSAVAVGSWQAVAPQSYTIADNTIVGIGNDPGQANYWSRYPITSAAINVLGGSAAVSRNHVTNSFWGIIATPYSTRAPITLTVVDNVVQSTYLPIGRVGQLTTSASVAMNWNDVTDYAYLQSDTASGPLNLRCNWWGSADGPKSNLTSLNKQPFTPWASAPVAGQPHTGCDASGAALASITVTPNPDTLVAGATQQFVATGRDGNGNVIPVTPAWSVTRGGGTINSEGLFTAGSVVGTYPNTIVASVGPIYGAASVTVVGVTCTGGPTLGCGLGADQFSLVPAGTFQMGTAEGTAVETPVHTVTLSQAFYLQRTEVTQAQWKAVMGSNPSQNPACGDTCPVDQVSWNDIQTFISALNASTPGVTYRLPTEAEWEYGARAGTTGLTYGSISDIAWTFENSGGSSHAVAGKQPNALGLFDMLGNVYEWVQDWIDQYPISPVTDPVVMTQSSWGAWRVFRGGAWYNPASYSTSALRNADSPSSTSSIGFRLVRTP